MGVRGFLKSLLVRSFDTELGKPGQYSENKFYRGALRDMFEFPSGYLSTRGELIRWLWDLEAEKGYKMVNLETTSLFRYLTDPEEEGKIRQFPSPYILSVPRDLVNMMIAMAQSRGLSWPRRLILVPAKSIVTIGARHFFKNIFFVFALGLSGVITDWMELNQEDPVLQETDTTQLAEDEIIVIVQMQSKDSVIQLENAIARGIAEQSEDKVRILDLSSETEKIGSSYDGKKRIEDFVESLPKETRIKKIIVNAHGKPYDGAFTKKTKVGWDAWERGIELEELAELFEPLKPRMNAESSVHFNSCALAINTEGQKDVVAFGDAFLHKGASVTVNLYSMPPGGRVFRGSLKDSGTVVKALALYNPAFIEPLLLGSFIFWRRMEVGVHRLNDWSKHDMSGMSLDGDKQKFIYTKE